MKLNLISIAVMAALGASTSAHALDFAFDPRGVAAPQSPPMYSTSYPVMALPKTATRRLPTFSTVVGSTGFTTYYQANLNSVVNSGSNVFSNGTGGNFFTFTAGFGEAVNFATQGGGVGFANFVFDANNPVNFFNMYATSATAVDLTGAGFVNGTPILTGHVASITTSSFTSNLGARPTLTASVAMIGAASKP